MASPIRPARAVEISRTPEGFPSEQEVHDAYDEADLNRAVEAYRFFYPTVSGYACYEGSRAAGIVPNTTFGILAGSPLQLLFTANADTPYGCCLLDLSEGPITAELPPGPLVAVANDLNQRWVGDLGLAGPDAGKGGKHVFVPPDYSGPVPADHFVWRSGTHRVMFAIRAIPINGDLPAAFELLKTVRVRPLSPSDSRNEPKWLEVSDREFDMTPLSYEEGIGFWERLNEVIQLEPFFEGYRNFYGELAVLGIEKGRPFEPDSRMRRILERAARTGRGQMRVQAFADRRSDRGIWEDRATWEWLSLTPESGTFDRETHADLDAREKWFFQAVIESPAMFRRRVGSGSVYCGGYRDSAGAFLDGGSTYRLTVPQPVPASLFWSVTVYDARTRSMIRTDQNKAALRSLFELKEKAGASSVELFFGPSPPPGEERAWIRTLPGVGWFACLRIYGPREGAFDGSWRPGDIDKTG